MKRVAVIIVTFNSEAEIGPCIEALRAVGDFETVIVDNASTDGTVAEVLSRKVRLISNPTNLGFGAAVNVGVKSTEAPIILLLNPDVRLLSGVEALERRLDEPGVGAAGGLLVGEDGQPQVGFMARNLPSAFTLVLEVLGINRIWPDNPVNVRYRCKNLNPTQPALVEQPAGAFFMFSRFSWSAVGGFAENYFPVWFEDVDFCLRLKTAGLRIYYEPDGRAWHSGGHSVRRLERAAARKYWYGSLLSYGRQHFSFGAYRALCLAVAGGSLLRGVLGMGTRGELVAQAGVAGLALKRFLGLRDDSERV